MSFVAENQLGIKLLRAETEQEVLAIVGADSDMSNDDNWHPIGGEKGNNSIIGNQSAAAEKAVTELMTNMVDAILMKRCEEKEIFPRDSAAPRTMYDAVNEFILPNLQRGRIVNADKSWLKSYGEKNLLIGTTLKSGKKAPCLTFADNGEGQHPQDFSTTFLSFKDKEGKRGKSSIPFVQGRFHMGSTGVLNYCGTHWFKLIISRRYTKDGNWGWTLIRKKHREDEEHYAEYYSLDGDKVPELESINNLEPFCDVDGRPIENFSLQSGTIIKLYNYFLNRSIDYKNLGEMLNMNMVTTLLPFRLLHIDKKAEKKGELRRRGVAERGCYGLECALKRFAEEEEGDIDSLDSVSDSTFHDLGDFWDPRLGNIKITAMFLESLKKLPAWYKKSNPRVFHHVNGQVHYKERRGQLSYWKFPSLKDRIAILVDASGLNKNAHSEIWKGDRESIKRTETGIAYLGAVAERITKNDKLKALNDKAAQDTADDISTGNTPEFLASLKNYNSDILDLLRNKIPEGLPKVAPEKRIDHPNLNYSPTKLVLRTKKPVLEIDIEKSNPIPFETDVKADYFARSDCPGNFYFPDDDAIKELFAIGRTYDSPPNLTMFLQAQKNAVHLEQEIDIKVGLKDDSMAAPVMADRVLRVKIIKRGEKPPVPPPPPRPPKEAVGLPDLILVTRDGREIAGDRSRKWTEVPVSDFNAKDGGFIEDRADDKKIYYLNMDNASFQRHLRHQRSDSGTKIAVKKYIEGMRLALLGIDTSFSNEKSASGDRKEEQERIEKDEFSRKAAQGMASVVMFMCEALPKHFDKTADNDSDTE
ncbi:MAG: hypothetical protein OXC45_05360 [Gemmatimonadetes bacterium]|nr:hypothetical protein [Gemmatimonadota bacterium]